MQTTVVSIHINNIDDTSNYIGNGGQCKANGQTDALLKASHQQRTNADTNIIGKHICGVGDTTLRCGSGSHDKGLEQRLQDAIPQSKKEAGQEQMDTA